MQHPRPFTELEKRFLRAIRDNIHSRPDFYEPGVRFILRQYGTRAQFVEESRLFRESRKVFGGTVPYPAPRRRRPTPLRILGPAFGGLEESGIGTPDDDLREFDADKAKAVVVLTWLLTDKDADQHALGRRFGPWHHEAGGREMVRWGTLDEDGRRKRWMKLARHALRTLTPRESSNSWLKRICATNSAGFGNTGELASAMIRKPSTQALDGKQRQTLVANNDDARMTAPENLSPLQQQQMGISAGGSDSTDRRAHPRANLTNEEANIRAREFLRQHPNATIRQVAAGIGCSSGLVSKLTAWKMVREERLKGRQSKNMQVVCLTPKLENSLGTQDESLAKLIAEQEADSEPSPLEPNRTADRDRVPRTVKFYRKR